MIQDNHYFILLPDNIYFVILLYCQLIDYINFCINCKTIYTYTGLFYNITRLLTSLHLLFYQTVFNYITRLNFFFITRLGLYFIIGLLQDYRPTHCKAIFYYNQITKRIYFIVLQKLYFILLQDYILLGLNFKTVFYNTLQQYILLCYN